MFDTILGTDAQPTQTNAESGTRMLWGTANTAQDNGTPNAEELRGRTDDRPPLAHRTDRIALRNESNIPVMYVDDDPLFSLAPDAESVRQNPLKTSISDIRHQHYGVDADALEESEAVIRELADQFDADTEQSFYYTIAGERAQISGNGLDDYFDAIDTFRTTYKGLDEQLEPPEERQQPGFPHQPMPVTCVGLTRVEGVWLRFDIRLTDAPDERYYTSTTLWVTTLEQHGPLTTRRLEDQLDHPDLGSPSAIARQYTQAQADLPLSPAPLTSVKEHRLIGYRGRENPVEYITCENPFYRAEQTECSEQYHRLDEAGVSRDVIPQLINIDRLPLRPRGGSHGIDEDCFIRSGVTATLFKTGFSAGVVLLSGKTTPVLKDEYAEWEAKVLAERERKNRGFLDRLKP